MPCKEQQGRQAQQQAGQGPQPSGPDDQPPQPTEDQRGPGHDQRDEQHRHRQVVRVPHLQREHHRHRGHEPEPRGPDHQHQCREVEDASHGGQPAKFFGRWATSCQVCSLDHPLHIGPSSRARISAPTIVQALRRDFCAKAEIRPHPIVLPPAMAIDARSRGGLGD